MKATQFLRPLLALCLLCAPLNGRAALTIEPPTMPGILSDTLVPGNSYYLYNIGKRQYMNQNTSNTGYCGWSDTPFAFRLDNSSDGYYAFWQGSYYIGNGSSVQWSYSSSATNTYVRYDVQGSNGIYKIRDVYYNSYIGYYSNDASYVYFNVTTSPNNTWLLIPSTATAAQQTAATTLAPKQLLYNAIANADSLGYSVQYYERIYKDSSKTDAELFAAANELNNAVSFTSTNSYIFPSWNDYKILIGSSNFSRYNSDNYLYTSWGSNTQNTSRSLSAIVNITEPSTFVINARYDNSTNHQMQMKIYVDDVLALDYNGDMYYDYYYRYLYNRDKSTDESAITSSSYNNSNYSTNTGRRYFVDLPTGEHRIRIEFTKLESDYTRYTYIYELGIEKTPTISVNLAAEGRLGDEVLMAMNAIDPDNIHIRNVRNLVVSGKMGTEDWNQLKSMTSLFKLDLSGTDITSVPAQFFSRIANSAYTGFLHQVKLPETVTSIGDEAFLASFADIELSQALTTVGTRAFANSNITSAIMPNVETVYDYAFHNCLWLKNITMRKVKTIYHRAFTACENVDTLICLGPITTIPHYAFDGCKAIKHIELTDSIETIKTNGFYNNRTSPLTKLPAKLKTIGNYALYNNLNATFSLPEGLTTIGACGLQSCDRMTGDIPSTVTTIGEKAFYYAWYTSNEDTIHLPASATYGNAAFQYARMKNVVIPENFASFSQTNFFANCDSLKSIKLMCPNMVTVPSDFVSGLTKANIKVVVPDYLWSTYKKDNYWMDFNVQTFSTAEMDSIVLRQNLALGQSFRFEGTPSLALQSGVQFAVEGTNGMSLADVVLNQNLSTDSYSQVWTYNDNIRVGGDLSERVYTAANKWYFIALPFDCDLSRTATEGGAQYAIRYYDGASRAQSLTASGNWKKYDVSQDIVKAGTGFIYMTSQACWTRFYAADNGTKQSVFYSATNENNEVHLALEKNECDDAEHRGWNLVGNPYPNYYNNHNINFPAPITLWTGTTYQAYSLRDDDVAIKPLQAIFVQCPEEVAEISFPAAGRQTSSVIESQANAPSRTSLAGDDGRRLIDLTLGDGTYTDRTRIVINPQASTAYELTCDAGKLMSIDEAVQQLFSLGADGAMYAINERPLADGTVRLGFYAPQDGTYTLTLSRSQAAQVLLADAETGMTTDLTATGSYTFRAAQGTDQSRLTLLIVAPEATGIAATGAEARLCAAEYFTTDGRRVNTLSAPGIYIVRQGESTRKIVVK